jgi:hypothetical protein
MLSFIRQKNDRIVLYGTRFNQMGIGKTMNKMEWLQPRHLMPKEQEQLKQIKWYHELWQHTC